MSSPPTILIATWGEGVFVASGSSLTRELEGGNVTGLALDGLGRALAIIGGTALWRRSVDGQWAQLGSSAHELAACAAVGETVFVGTSDARVLRLEADATFAPLPSFEHVAGRETWYAGNTIIDGRVVGPPLGVRSMFATRDGSALLVNVHVGGIPRSTDLGKTWTPTIDVASDAHQVAAHPDRPQLVAAATALGLALSRDGGATWKIDDDGLHATHCLAVAFVGDEVWVSAATGPFADGAIYRRSIEGHGRFDRLGGSALPEWFERGVDTGNLAARGDVVAVADRGGQLYVSRDRGSIWELVTTVPGPSGLLVL